MAMSPSARKTKGKAFETKIANIIHDYFYNNLSEYKEAFDTFGTDQTKPRRDSSSGTFVTSNGDIELGILYNFFPVSIECKDHKDLNVSINSILKGDFKKLIDIYEKQCVPASKETEIPLLVFKGPRTQNFCMFNELEINDLTEYNIIDYLNRYVKYKKYIICIFEDVLEKYTYIRRKR